MFELQLLGPVRLRRDGAALVLPTHKAQALLILLALGGPAHRARVAAWLWPQQGDSSARRNLRRELARLRAAGAADALHSQGEVLSLTAEVQCDAVAFSAALNAGQPSSALQRWQGHPADGLQLDGSEAFGDWLAAERQRLLGQRQQALQAAATACEAAGDADAALAHLQTLLALDPLQEHAHRDVMRLQAAAGHREAALAQYARCRDLLATELGLEPAAATRALAERLRGSPAAAEISPPRPTDPPSPVSLPAELPLVGRDEAWAALQAAAEQARTLVIEGEAGIGKTRLAREFAAARGAYALAQCRRSDASVPYASFTRALRQLAADSLPRAGLPEWVLHELSRVLPELGPAPAQMTSAEDRRRFFEACAAAWLALAGGSFDTVIIDDWHLADDASRGLLGFIAAHRAERWTADTAAQPLEMFVLRPELDAAALADLHALLAGGQASRVLLTPWSDLAVLELVRRLSGSAEPRRFAHRLLRATGGNPFFVAETLRQWLGLQLLSSGPGGAWQTPFDDDTQDYRELPAPDSVRDAVLARVQRLPDTAQRLLEAAALASEPFRPALLAGACAMSEVQALAAVEQGIAAQLLREHDDSRGGFAFAHDLVQMALDSAIGPARRRSVHRRLALGGEACGQSAGLAHADIARHWEAGGEPQRAVRHRIAAAEAALALYSDGAALAHWQAALTDGPTLAQRLRIHQRRLALQRRHDDHPGLQNTLTALDTLQADALGQGQPELALDAAIEAAHLLSLEHDTAQALRRIDELLAASRPDADQRAHALLVRSQALNGVGRTAEAVQDAQAALAAAGLSQQRRAALLHSLAYSHFLRDEPGLALVCARRTLAIWRTTGDRGRMARAHANLGLFLSMQDDDDAARVEYQRALQMAGTMHQIDLQREVANNLAYMELKHGRASAALAVVQQAWDLSPHFAMPHRSVFLRGLQVQACTQRGELAAALDAAEDALARARSLEDTLAIADAVSMALDLFCFIGDAEGAARLLAALQGRSMEGLEYMRIKLVFNRVLHALRFGSVAQAREHLALLGDVAALSQPVDRVSGALAHAQLLLAEGRAAEALRWLDDWQPLARHVETALAMAELRLRAAPAEPVATRQARELLREPASVMHALQLRQTLLRQAAGDELAALRAEQAAAIERLAASLRQRPREQALFNAAWGPAAG